MSGADRAAGRAAGSTKPHSARVTVGKRCSALPIADPEGVLLVQLLARLGSALPDERIGDTVAGLLADRRALVALVDRLCSAVPRGRQRLIPVVHAVIAALAADHLTTALQVRLAAHSLPWAEVGNLLEARPMITTCRPMR